MLRLKLMQKMCLKLNVQGIRSRSARHELEIDYVFHIIDTLCFKLKKFHNRPQNKLIGQKVIILYKENRSGRI